MITTFYEQQRARTMAQPQESRLDYFEQLTEEWHSGAGENVSLREYLGLTKEEYQTFAINPSDLIFSK